MNISFVLFNKIFLYTNFVFFDEESATNFIKNNEKKIVRYNGSRTSNVEVLVRKPKIFVYNLEDFIESWEEKISTEASRTEKPIIQTIFNAQNTMFIPPQKNYKEAQLFLESDNSNINTKITKHLLQQISVKFRVFKSFVGILFSVGY